jgi:hypothetical protein
MALSMPAGVSYTRCGGLPRRGWPVVPLSTIAPASRLLNPSTRVYSSPKPTQPDSSTIGEANCSPQNRIASDCGSAVGGDDASAVGAVDGEAGANVAFIRRLSLCGLRLTTTPVLSVPLRPPA